jgi:4-diphosphocytidyl-2-C-methyl-D-erythritol kinase
MEVEIKSLAKVNFSLNVLNKRPDKFHELETLLYPIKLEDTIILSKSNSGLKIICDYPEVPINSDNLAWKAADLFLKTTNIKSGVDIKIIKQIPVAAGLGGGSSNAAAVLQGLKQLFQSDISDQELNNMAASLGSDVNFFLYSKPAIGTGRGEKLMTLPDFEIFHGKKILLINPGFGISTPWAYQNLGLFPKQLNGRPGYTMELAAILYSGKIPEPDFFFNALETPVFFKYPLLLLVKEFCLKNGAIMSLMSGSGSTVFALTSDIDIAKKIEDGIIKNFGKTFWTRIVSL